MLELDGLRCRTDQDIIVGGDNALGLGAADTCCVGCTQRLHQGKGTCGDFLRVCSEVLAGWHRCELCKSGVSVWLCPSLYSQHIG